MSISTNTPNEFDGEDLLINSVIIPGNTAKPGFGVAYNKDDFDALVKHAIGNGKERPLQGAEGIFKQGYALMLAVTEDYVDNYAFETTCQQAGSTDGNPSAEASYFVNLVSESNCREKGLRKDKLHKKPSQRAMIFLVKPGVTDISVWVSSPQDPEDMGDTLDAYEGFELKPPLKPASTPARQKRLTAEQKRKLH